MMNDKKYEEDIELSETLNNLKNKEVFKVPQGYFEDFHINILAETKEKTKPNKIISLYKPLLAIAAVFVVCFLVFFIFKNMENKNTMTTEKLTKELADIDNVTVEKYLISNVDDIDNDLLHTNTNIKNINIYNIDKEFDNLIINDLLDETSEEEINNIDI